MGAKSVASSVVASVPKKMTLAEAEEIVHRAATAFIDMGLAFERIKDDELWKEGGYGSFQDYLDQRYGWTTSYANKLIRSAKVCVNLSRKGISVLPNSERVARELSVIDSEELLVEIWGQATLVSDAPTAEQIREIVKEIASKEIEKAMASKPSPAPAKEKKPRPVEPSEVEKLEDEERDKLYEKKELTPLEQAALNAEVIEAFISELNGAKTDIRDVVEAPGLEVLKQYTRSICVHLDNAIATLRKCKFKSECPTCEGKGCPACEKRGWVT